MKILKIYFFFTLISLSKNDGYEKFFEVSGGPEYMYYFAKLYVGTPPVEQSAIIDTGSDTLAFPCDQCESRDCGTHQDPRFFTQNSTTFQFDMDCSITTFYKSNNVCQFIKSYAEGSSLLGFLASDYVRFKNSHRVNDSKLKRLNYNLKKDLRMKAEFGCTTKETGLFKTQYADGIFGLDNDSTLIDSIEKSATAKFKRPMVFNFGLCFHEKGGIMSIDLRSTDHNDKKLRYLNKKSKQMSKPLVFKYQKYKSYYEIIVHKFKIGNNEISVNPIDVMIDSGTTFTHMPTSYVEKILQGLNEYCKTHINKCGKIKNPNFDTESCLELKQPDNNYKNIQQLLESFPTIQVYTKKNDRPFVIYPHNYFYKEIDDSDNDPNIERVCMALKGEEEGKIILGAFSMVDYYFYFDRKDKELRIYKEDCYVRTTQLLMKKERILAEIYYQKIVYKLKNSQKFSIGFFVGTFLLFIISIFYIKKKKTKNLSQSLISNSKQTDNSGSKSVIQNDQNQTI